VLVWGGSRPARHRDWCEAAENGFRLDLVTLFVCVVFMSVRYQRVRVRRDTYHCM